MVLLWKNALCVTTLVVASSGVVHSFSIPDAVSLVNSGSEGLMNIVSTAESPMEAVSMLPNSVKAAGVAAVALPVAPSVLQVAKSIQQLGKNDKKAKGSGKKQSYSSSNIVTYPEGQAATYEMNDNVVPFEFGDAAFVRPLLKSTQLETRPLQVVYDANRDGYDAKTFHSKVDGKGAAVVLAKVAGQWCGGYNPRGWASLGQARSSVAAFLFYKQPLKGWQKCRVSRTGSMACGNDLYDSGIFFGADSFIIPLRQPNPRQVTSRLGQYFEPCPDGKLTILPRPSLEYELQELKILTGVYAPDEIIPNSGGVLELGYY
ncbi:TLD [Seminavis robusta]|uniref:TLD n=1 Tax=Seminavis robusta TaxID=568900 RepID=A0A9N8DPY3_9STRA|nr:TLD [Seminavis robusta]|eukprot:Sro255_g100380.1 TLD (317) ;mRNA; r:39249-40199